MRLSGQGDTETLGFKQLGNQSLERVSGKVT
jgi:hypothetical protein